MENKKKLLVIGAGDFQLPLVQEAAKTCDVVLAAPVISQTFDPYIKDRLITDVKDQDAILAFARAQKIDGVITDQTDIAVRSVAYVAENMGLPGIGTKAGHLFTDKSLMRRRLAELDIPRLNCRVCLPKRSLQMRFLFTGSCVPKRALVRGRNLPQTALSSVKPLKKTARMLRYLPAAGLIPPASS